jgi:hypothetical protein
VTPSEPGAALADSDRELLFARLSAHAAADHSELEELERRVAALGAGPGRPRWGRGHGESDGPAPGWRPTDERFRDPRTRLVMRVWQDAAGGRHYVADDRG